MQRFTELKVWQRAHALVLEVYRISTSFPQEERFGVTSQLRRAITSVPTNIAEGSRRQGQQEYSPPTWTGWPACSMACGRRWTGRDRRARSAAGDSRLLTLNSRQRGSAAVRPLVAAEPR
jgi:hypothetical protein